MNFIILDLEWNGNYARRAHGYFNEIVEVGAIKLDERGERLDEFHAYIKPIMTRKLTKRVEDMTGLTKETLADGDTFAAVVEALEDWVGGPDSTLVTWSTTDLLVLIENCTFFFQNGHIPFMHHYLDLQDCCQRLLGVDKAHQLGLTAACERLEITSDDLNWHHALDDCELTARIFQKIYTEQRFGADIRPADQAFYDRLTFKTTVISNIDNPLVKKEDFVFSCEQCGGPLKPTRSWGFRNHAFCSELRCSRCKCTYNARVQYKVKYEGVELRKKLSLRQPKEAQEAQPTGQQTGVAEASTAPQTKG